MSTFDVYGTNSALQGSSPSPIAPAQQGYPEGSHPPSLIVPGSPTMHTAETHQNEVHQDAQGAKDQSTVPSVGTWHQEHVRGTNLARKYGLDI